MTDRSVKVRLDLQVAGAQANLQRLKMATSDFSREIDRVEKKKQAFRDVGTAAGAVGLAMSAGIGAAVLANTRFEKSMSAVQAATHETAGNMQLLETAAIQAGAKTAFSATEAAGGIEELAKAGVSTKDVLAGGLRGALDLAAAGTIPVAEAAETAASTMNQFGLAGRDVTHIADVLAATAGKAQGSVSDVGQAFKYVGPVAAAMGVSLEETAGAVGLLASRGILADQAGTSLRGMLSSLTSPSKVASDTMKQLGVNVYDAQGEFVGFDGVAGQLNERMKGLTNTERDQALGRLFGNEQITAARILYEGGATAVEKWTKKVDDDAYATETASIKMNNLAGDVEKLKGSLETALIGTGRGAEGPLRNLVQTGDDLVGVYNDLPGPLKSTALGLAGVTAAVGGGTFVATRAVLGFKSMNETLETLGVRSKKAGAEVEGFNRRALAVRGGALAVGAGLTALSGKAEEANRGLGVLTSAAGSAALGFSVAGPWGAAIGGGIGLLTSLAGASGDTGADISALTATLDANTGAVTKNTGAWIANDLRESGVIDAARSIGISLDTLTAAAMGNAQAVGEVRLAMKSANAELPEFYGGEQVEMTEGAKAAKKVADAVGGLSGKVKSSKKEWAENKTVTDAVTGSQKDVKGAVAGTTGAIDQQVQSVEDLKRAQDDARDAALSTYESQTNLQRAYRDARDAARENRNGLLRGGEAAIKARESIAGLARQWNNASNEAQDKKGAYRTARRNYIELAVAMGKSEKAAKRMADKYLEIPKKRTTKVETTGIPEAERKIEDFKGNVRRALNDVGPFQVDVTLSAKALTALGSIDKAGFNKGGTGNAGAFGLNRAVGGEIPLWMGERGKDSVPVMAMPGEHMWTTKEVEAVGGQGAMYAMRKAALRGAFSEGIPGVQRLAEGGVVLNVRGRPDMASVNTAAGQIESSFQRLTDSFERTLGQQVSKAVKAAADAAARGGVGSLAGLSGAASDRTSKDGEPLTRITKAQIILAERLSGLAFRVMQGSFQPATSYSGTSHTGPGVADIAPAGPFAGQGWLRRVGFASWARNIPGAHSAGSGAHTHNVSLLDPGSRNNGQARAYRGGGDGLGGRDYGPNPPVLADLVDRIKAMGVGLANGGEVGWGGLRDSGGLFRSGTFVGNLSGRDEWVADPDKTQHLAQGGAVTKTEKLAMAPTNMLVNPGWANTLATALASNTVAVKANTAKQPSVSQATTSLTAARRRMSEFGRVDAAYEAARDRASNAASNRASRLDLLNQQRTIRDLQKELNGKGDDRLKGKLNRQIARTELAEAKREYARMQASRVELDRARAALEVARRNRARYGSTAAEEQRLVAAEAALEAAQARATAAAEAAQERAQTINEATTRVTAAGGIGELSSPAAVERNLNRALADLAAFTQVMGELRSVGAPVWLLTQLDEAGPTRGAIRLARRYLADRPALARLATSANLYSQVAQSYGQMTNDPRWMQSGAWSGATSTTQKQVLVQIQTLDVSRVGDEIDRRVRLTLDSLLRPQEVGG